MLPEPMALHYRPGTPGRGEDTARRILLAAIEVFADEGYEGASTRSLASHAGVNAPAIQYYFGSKEGLYRAVIGHIANLVEERLGPVALRIGERAERAAGARRTDGAAVRPARRLSRPDRLSRHSRGSGAPDCARRDRECGGARPAAAGGHAACLRSSDRADRAAARPRSERRRGKDPHLHDFRPGAGLQEAHHEDGRLSGARLGRSRRAADQDTSPRSCGNRRRAILTVATETQP